MITKTDIEKIIGVKSPVTITVQTCSQNAVRSYYEFWYGKPRDLKGFYCPMSKTVYCVNEPRVIAHELTHGILANYFTQHIPVWLQELAAQYVEERI